MNLLVEMRRVKEGSLRRLKYLILKLTTRELGRDCQISRGVRLINPQNIIIGNRVILNERVLVQSCEGAMVNIGNDVILSYDAMIITGGRDIVSGEIANYHVSQPVRLEDKVWIGARAVILPGVTIGKGAVVGAGSVVTHNVEPGWIVAGVPAKLVKSILLNSN